MTEQESKKIRKDFLSVADVIGLKAGAKVPEKEAARKTGESILAKVIEEQKLILSACGVMYDLIDTDDDGYICVTEFKVFLKVLGADITDEKATRC
ncbi:hypothetical protein, partial [Salmonella sp. s54412]|uniref:hypothetical protein n=1 Tax=Salmonella sp. s54412 TaxID=3160128 RepID=UPI0037540FE0